MKTRAIACSQSPSPTAFSSSATSYCSRAQAVPRIRGSVSTIATSASSSIGTTTTTQSVITPRAHGFSSLASGSPQRHGKAPSSVGLMRWNRSGTPVTSASTW